MQKCSRLVAAVAAVDALTAAADAVDALWAVVEAPGTAVYRYSRDGVRGGCG